MIKTTWHDRVAVLSLDRPASLNAVDPALLDALGAGIDDAIERHGAGAIVLTGEGRAFCAGADLRWFAQRSTQGAQAQAAALDEMLEAGGRVVRALLTARVPVISAVNGPCVGGALGIALSSDLALAARSAYFSLPQVPQLGIVPDLGATWLMPRLVGRPRALAASLLGERIPAEQAEQWGLVWRCVADADLHALALVMARRLAAVPGEAIVRTRRLLDASLAASMAQQLDDEGRQQQALVDAPGLAAS